MGALGCPLVPCRRSVRRAAPSPSSSKTALRVVLLRKLLMLPTTGMAWLDGNLVSANKTSLTDNQSGKRKGRKTLE
eukprot:910965-Amphidinium_carterae.1